MRTPLRQRLLIRVSGASEEGMTLIELLVAIFILTFGLFALLGSLIAAAQSVQHQQARSAATRLATEALEQARGTGFEELEIDELGTTTAQNVNGLDFAITRTVEWMAAGDDPDAEEIKDVTVTVTWTQRDTERSLVFRTAVAPVEGPPHHLNPDPDPIIVSVTVEPNPTTISSAEESEGQPVQNLAITARLRNFDTAANVTVTWTDDEGTKTRGLDFLGNLQWRGVINKDDITYVLAGEKVPELTFLVEATFGSDEAERSYVLQLQEQGANKPEFQTASVTPTPFSVNAEHPNHGCSQGNNCKNRDDLTLTAQVSNLGGQTDEPSSVKVRWIRWDGSQGEIALVRQQGSGNNTWSVTIARHSETFLPGTNPFVFIATRASDGEQATTTRNVQVNVQ